MDCNSIPSCSVSEKPAGNSLPGFAPPVKSEQLPAGKKLTKDLVLSKSKGGSLIEIKKIVVWGQKITDCSIVTEIPELEVASMNANQISSLEHFGQCPNLRELFLRSNRIEDIREIYYLKDLPNLQVLWLAGNPCTKHAKYRSTVIRNLEQLQKLDDTEISQLERTASESDGLLFEAPPAGDPAAANVAESDAAAAPFTDDDLAQRMRPAEDICVVAVAAAPPPPQPQLLDGSSPEAPLASASAELAVEKPTEAEASALSLPGAATSSAAGALSASRPCTSAPAAGLPRYAMAEVRTAVLRLIRVLDQESLQLVLLTVRSRLEAESGSQDAGGAPDISTAFSLENL